MKRLRRPPRRDLLLLAGLLLLGIAWLQPALHIPFRFDDTFNFELRTGALEAQQLHFRDYFQRSLESIFASGRTQPLGAALNVIPYVFSDEPALYKLYLLLMTLAVFALAWRLARRLGASPALAGLIVVLSIGFVQLRRYHDALLDYSGVVQLSLLLGLGAALAWLRHDDSGRRRWLLTAVVLWCACLMLYEVNIALAPAVIAVVAARRRTVMGTVRGSLAFVGPLVGMAAVILLVRATKEAPGAYYNPGGGITATLETWAVILLGAVPATYAIFDPVEHMGQPTTPEVISAVWRGLLAATLVGLLVRRPAAGTALRGLALVGLALWVFSSAPIAASAKYQGELKAGMTYIPGLMAMLGFAILVAAGATALVQAAGRRGARPRLAATAVVALAVGGAAGITGLGNMRVAADAQPTLRTRALFNDALRHGVLRDLPADATVIGYSRDLQWYPSNFTVDKITYDGVAADRTGRRYDMRVDIALPPVPCPRRRWAWPREHCEEAGLFGGWLAIRPQYGGADVAALAIAPPGRVADGRAPTERLVVYAEDWRAEQPPVLTGRLPDDQPWRSDGVHWTRTERGDGWAIWRGRFGKDAPRPMTSTVDPGGQVAFTVPATGAQRVRWLGTRQLLP